MLVSVGSEVGRGVMKGYNATTGLIGLGQKYDVMARLREHF